MHNLTVDKFGRQNITRLEKVRGRPGIGFKLNASGHYDLQKKRLTNISEPIESFDATTKIYVDETAFQYQARIEEILKEYIKEHVYKLKKVLAEVIEHEISEQAKIIMEQTSNDRLKIIEIIHEITEQEVIEFSKSIIDQSSNDKRELTELIRNLEKKIENHENANKQIKK